MDNLWDALDARSLGPQESCPRCGWTDEFCRRQISDLRINERAFTDSARTWEGDIKPAPVGGWPVLWIPHGLIVSRRIGQALESAGLRGFVARPIFVGSDQTPYPDWLQVVPTVPLEARPEAIGLPETGICCLCGAVYQDFTGPMPFSRQRLGDADFGSLGVGGTWTFVSRRAYGLLLSLGDVGIAPASLGRLV
jgi:hypothetical protein